MFFFVELHANTAATVIAKQTGRRVGAAILGQGRVLGDDEFGKSHADKIVHGRINNLATHRTVADEKLRDGFVKMKLNPTTVIPPFTTAFTILPAIFWILRDNQNAEGTWGQRIHGGDARGFLGVLYRQVRGLSPDRTSRD